MVHVFLGHVKRLMNLFPTFLLLLIRKTRRERRHNHRCPSLKMSMDDRQGEGGRLSKSECEQKFAS